MMEKSKIGKRKIFQWFRNNYLKDKSRKSQAMLTLTRFQPIFHFSVPFHLRFSDVFTGYESRIFIGNGSRLILIVIK